MRSLKQPRGLPLLFFSELWERFGYYTVNTIIVLYMITVLKMSDAHADVLYGTFSALIYLTPVAGGYLADRFLGFQRSIIFGGIIYIIGYIITAIPGQEYLFIGLSFVILGNGFFKPNVSSLVGELYGKNDPRRVAGFTIFYMGINIGSLLPPLFIGAVVDNISWNAAFMFAGGGMLIGVIIFLLFRSRLGQHGLYPRKPNIKSQSEITRKLSHKFLVLLGTGLILTIFLINVAFVHPQATTYILIATNIIAITAVVFFLFKEEVSERNKMIAALILIIISIGFWAVYVQTFSSMMLFAKRNMAKGFLGFHINPEFTQFFNPFFILLFAPFISKLWLKLGKYNPSIPVKFALGVLFSGLGFVVLAFAINHFSHHGLLSPWWLVTAYGITTIGELCLSPVGLAMITELSPKHLVGMMMGVWFLSLSAAFAIGGQLATIAAAPDNVSPVITQSIYHHAFLIYGMIALLLSVIAFAAAPFLKKLIHAPTVKSLQ